jgi:hypothetical protein
MEKKVNLNEHQVELLFDLAECHLIWYNKYYMEDEIPMFHTLLQLNHIKISQKLPKNYDDDDIFKQMNILKQKYIDITSSKRK